MTATALHTGSWRATYLAIGIDEGGPKDVLGLWLGEHEGAAATAPPAGTALSTGTSRTARARCHAP